MVFVSKPGKQRKGHSFAKRAVIAGSIVAALAAGSHAGLGARVNKLNAEIALRNAARPTAIAKEFPVDLSYGKIFRGKFSSVINNPNKPGNCSGYSLRVAARFGKTFVFADAWDMGKKNSVVARAIFDRKKIAGGFSKEDFSKMLRNGTVSKGTIVGVFYRDSKNNLPNREFTHIVVYAGKDSVGKDIFWHNFHGPNSLSLEELFSAKNKSGERIFFPLAVIEPNANGK